MASQQKGSKWRLTCEAKAGVGGRLPQRMSSPLRRHRACTSQVGHQPAIEEPRVTIEEPERAAATCTNVTPDCMQGSSYSILPSTCVYSEAHPPILGSNPPILGRKNGGGGNIWRCDGDAGLARRRLFMWRARGRGGCRVRRFGVSSQARRWAPTCGARRCSSTRPSLAISRRVGRRHLISTS